MEHNTRNADLSRTSYVDNTSITIQNFPLENNSSISIASYETECVSKIIQILELDDSPDSEMIAKQIMINGRKALYDYQDEIAPEIFRIQMYNTPCEILDALKIYVEEQWRKMIREQWFHKFLEQRRSESDECYDKVLTRAAQYGSTFSKDNILLSLTLQLLFEFDDEEMKNSNVFDRLWNSLISEGLQCIRQYEEHIARNMLEQQLNNDRSPLYLALSDYFSAPLRDLLQLEEISRNKSDLFNTALYCVTMNGWWEGLRHEKVKDSIAPKKFKLLIKKLEAYLKSRNLPIVIQSSLSQSAQHIVTSDGSSFPDTNNMHMSSHPGTNESTVYNSSLFNDNSLSDTANDRQERISECQKMKACINEHEKLQLSNLVEAGELMYIEKTFDRVLDEILEGYSFNQNFTAFINTCFTPIMYLLKRQQNLNEFCENLIFKYLSADSILTEVKLSQRMIIHILLLNSDLSLSRKLMILLSKRNPVPLVEPSLQNDVEQYQFVSNIIHVWNYCTPTVLSFGIGPCSGKSTLLNTIFLSTFAQSVPSIYFQNTIDIDFAYSFLPHRSANIADAHGVMKKDLLEKIHDLFDAFIIHIEYTALMNQVEFVKEILYVIRNNAKYRLIIIRDVPLNDFNKCSNILSSLSQEIEYFILPNVADQNSQQNKLFIRKLSDKIWGKLPVQCLYDETYLKDKLKQLMSVESRRYLEETYSYIQPLEDKLLEMASNLSPVNQYLPEYTEFVELCQLKLKLARFNFFGNESDAVVFETRRKIYELETRSNKNGNDSNIIHTLFLCVLEAPNMFACIELLIDDLRRKRSHLLSAAEMATELPIHKSLSLEILWRNAIVCHQNRRIIIDKYYTYVRAGFPFEIIDGDNFYFQSSFLLEVLRPFRDYRTLVISIIGPQSSGKSTLLNYMFGTLFDVRDGRCTRGIYGSFVKTNRSDFEYVMLLDTEGLLSVEREDPEFDRRIVLFCLAVSHVVLVNMAGEVNTTLQDMLTLCTDSLEKIGVSRIPKPMVHFILNQKADLNIEHHVTAIDHIITSLKKLGLGETIDLRKETFHTLPSAYKREGQILKSSVPSPKVVQTAPEFIECVQLLCGNIITSARSYFDAADEFLNPLQWLTSSKTIFDTLEKFSDLTYYRDIHERRLDDQIREHIRTDLTKFFPADFRDQLIFDSLHKTEREINDLLLSKQHTIQDIAQESLQSLFKSIRASEVLRTRSQQFLDIQIRDTISALRTSTMAANERETIKSIVRNGEGDLRKLIDDVIQSGRQTSKSEASAKFDNIFGATLQSLQNRFIPEVTLRQAFNHIYTNYNIYGKGFLPEYGYITHHFPMLSILTHNQISLDYAAEELVIRFSYHGYQESCVMTHSYSPKAQYSLDMIVNLVFLNKELLRKKFTEYINTTDTNLNKSYENYEYRQNCTKPNDKHSQVSIDVAMDRFQLKTRDIIQHEKPASLTVTNINENEMYFPITRAFQEIINRTTKAMQNTEDGQVRQIRTELIQRIVGIINSLTIEINNELAPFCVSVTRQLKSTFHTCAVVLLTKYYYDQQMNLFFQNLSELETRKDDLKNYFVSMTVPDTSADEGCAIGFAKQLKEHLIELFTEEGQRTINQTLNQYDGLNRKWIQNCCDGKLLTSNENWLLEYIESPIKIIEQFFLEMWSNVEGIINQKLTDRKSYYINILNEFFFCIQGMLDAMSRLGGPSVTFVNDIFIPVETNILDAHQNLINKQRCMASLFFQYFTETQIPLSFHINGNKYNLRSDVVDKFQLLCQQRQPSSELSTMIAKLIAIYSRISIVNFIVFLNVLVQEIKVLLKDFDQIKCDFSSIDKQDTYANILDKVRGCPELCPCCKRPCDVDHAQLQSIPGSMYNEHRCLSGHALRGMNGYRFEVTEEASLLMCDQIQDNQVMVIGALRCQWSQFKRNRPDWRFDSALNDEELNRLHGKFLTIWQRIGPRLCTKFNMKFVTHNAIQKITLVAFHYVLLLDASGSMSGAKWRDLMKAVEEFLKRRCSMHTQDRATIIVFSDKVQVSFSNENINSIDVDRIEYIGGCTSFKAAFSCVNECLGKFSQARSTNPTPMQSVIVFMSDGDAEYPEEELNQLWNNHGTDIRSFWTLALHEKDSSSRAILARINERMNGSFFDVATSTDLIQIYAEVASKL